MSNVTVTGTLTVEPVAAQAIQFKSIEVAPAGHVLHTASAVTDASGAWSVALPASTDRDLWVARVGDSPAETQFRVPPSASPVAIDDCLIPNPFGPRPVVQVVPVSASAGGGGSVDLSGLLPVADPAGVTIEAYPNPSTGEGTIDVLTFPADAVALAIKLAGDDFPRWLLFADGGDGLYFGDGTFDPYSGNSSINYHLGGVSLGGDTYIGGSGTGIIQRTPNGSHRRIKIANDGTLSTEVVA